MPAGIVKVFSQPGVKRDGTRLEGNFHVDAQWCRWHRGLPRKMRGFKTVAADLTEKVYGMHAYVVGGSEYVHAGSASALPQRVLDYNGTLLTSSDRIPAAFANSTNNVWQFDTLYDSVSASNRIIAHAAPNLSDISNSTKGKVYYGDVTSTAALTDTGGPQVSGGIVSVHPYLVSFGDAGEVNWSDANKPATWGVASFARVAASKIVRGMQLRGTGGGPAALLWSLDALVRMQFTGGSTIWAFDTLSDDISVLSSNGIVEYDGVYYWAGVDRFMMFNGVVRELPNQMNLDWFYDDSEGGLNYAQRQKVFAIKMPRWGEIWWCYPRGTATECTHAVIYNVRENTWYDTQLPSAGRSAGTYAKVYEHPLMTGVDLTTDNKYRLIKHEEGYNAVDGTDVQAIQSYFETNELTMLEGAQPANNSLHVLRLEPDFHQDGSMSVTVKGRPNARAEVQTGQTVTFPDTQDGQTVKLKDAFRLMSFRFESNAQDGEYVAGDTYAHVEPADGRIDL